MTEALFIRNVSFTSLICLLAELCVCPWLVPPPATRGVLHANMQHAKNYSVPAHLNIPPKKSYARERVESPSEFYTDEKTAWGKQTHLRQQEVGQETNSIHLPLALIWDDMPGLARAGGAPGCRLGNMLLPVPSALGGTRAGLIRPHSLAP
jgi:hypothetical protein